jgi:hypothetical protein
LQAAKKTILAFVRMVPCPHRMIFLTQRKAMQKMLATSLKFCTPTAVASSKMM